MDRESKVDDPAQNVGQILGAALDEVVAAFADPEVKEKACGEGLLVLDRIIAYARDLLAYQRAAFGAEAVAGGSDIDTWTGPDIERHPEMMEATRQVTGQMLALFPGILPPVADNHLCHDLWNLNAGAPTHLLNPPARGRGGASQAQRDRKLALRAMFWIRVGFDGSTRADMVTHFVNLTGLDVRTIESVAGPETAEVAQVNKQAGKRRREAPTDSQIIHVAKLGS